MTDLVSFTFDDSLVRVIQRPDGPWWIAADVAAILGYDHTPSMVRKLDDDEADVQNVHSSGQQREMTIISESGLYNAIFRSRRPEARRFRRWVTGEVLPQLRRHGSYSLPGMAQDPALVEIDSARLSASIAVVRECRRLFGPQSARLVWFRLGLPLPLADDGPNGPMALASDPLAADLAAFLATVEATTIDEAAAAIGMPRPDAGTRLRVGGLLRLLGWFPRKVRRGRATVNLFAPANAVGDLSDAA